MLFGSYETFFGIILAVLVFRFVRKFLPQQQTVQQLTLLAVNAVILLTVVREHTLIVLAILSLLVYTVGRAQKGQRVAIGAMIATVVALFAARNYEALRMALPALEGPLLSVERVGLSYIVFRMVHWLVENKKDQIHSAHPLTFLNYIFFFPTFLAGPIDTYPNFHHSAGRLPHPSWWAYGAGRITLGAAKTLLLVPLVRPWAMDFHTVAADTGLSHGPALALSLLAYSAYILFDFSGYSDIAIGVGRWLGFRLPENFRTPYLATNLADFWRRWHISFSTFLRRYVFKPILALLNRSAKLARHREPVTLLAYLTTFLICGLWHGDALHFAIWGLWHGTGLSVARLYRNRRPSWAHGRLYDLASTALTFTFVTIGWYAFHYDIG